LNYSLHNDPNLPLAWGPWFSHEYITYFAAQALERLMSLPNVPVLPNPRYGDKLWSTGPKHIDVYKENYHAHRQLDPLWSFDYRKRNGDFASEPPLGKTIEPWKVLVIYSTEPDLYLDCDLNLHKNQKITGGSHGWRHMQFKLPGMTFGIAPQSFRVHKDMAKLAFENGNDYWGWRNLSRSAHYLADLGHPFHVKALPGAFLMKKIFSRQDLFKIVSAMHQSYEIYTERRFREGFEPFKQALLRGAHEGQAAARDVQDHLQAYIKRAEKKHNPIFYYFLDQFGQDLLDAFGQMDPNSQLDAATQTNRCSADAARAIFKEANLSKFAFLDKITVEILTDVGRMLGALFSGFSSLRK
jgi:hypothetical protein